MTNSIIALDLNKKLWEHKSPFPHLVTNQLVPQDTLEDVVESWPDPHWTNWRQFQNRKFAVCQFDNCTTQVQNLIRQLNGEGFCRHLSWLTGIPNILSDPRIVGGGMHETRTGGKLGMHLDFNRLADPRATTSDGLGLYRRLNLLIYLNPPTSPKSGGWLELASGSSEADPRFFIQPVIGTQVLMSVQPDGWHGHPVPLEETASPRRSIALYYYTRECPVGYTRHLKSTNYNFGG